MGSAGGLGNGLLEIALMLGGIALLALLIGNSSSTVAVISQAGNTYDQLLQTVTLQGGNGIKLGGDIH